MSYIKDPQRTHRTAFSVHSHLIRVVACALIAVGLSILAPTAAFDDGLLSFEDRVRCQRRIEEVYWQHRIWPAENPGAKPTLDELLPEALLRERVAGDLQKSVALELFWQRPLTGEQLQAELNRMVRDTKDPERLRELFAALDDDPFLVAECLARPVLTERLLRNSYARDTRFHGGLREQAEAALATHSNEPVSMEDLGLTYAEMEWRLAADEPQGTAVEAESVEHPVVELNTEDWHARLRHLAATFGIGRDPGETFSAAAFLERVPLDRLSGLVEENDRFVATKVLSKQEDRLQTATVTWPKRPHADWWAEEGHAVVESAGPVHPVSPPLGGYELRSPADDGCTADTWTEMWYVPSPRGDHTAVWTGTEMIVWGGFDNTGGRYDPATDSWRATSTGAGVPRGRFYHTAVWTGTEMIVWGGSDGWSYQNTGGRYDPSTDTWTATATGAGVPTARYFHTTVWTGTEMIVWGGRINHGPFAYQNSGGRYDPATDSWNPTSTSAGVPTGRDHHTAVWTGTEMIVWGGKDEPGTDGIRNSGARYDPATDTWRATSTSFGVPNARAVHSAVWTGTEMIVWGGFRYAGSDVIYLVTGGRYDPATNRWFATSTGAGVPIPRSNHKAVWTGTEMIVWGGVFDGAELNSGGRYDPGTNSWNATSTDPGAPTPRQHHTAVWTGTEMIVWGGYMVFGGSELTGGRYDPSTDKWAATSTGVGVPAQRQRHAAVWTGAEMIVWGGDVHGDETNSGGRYDPVTDSWMETSTGSGVPTGRQRHSAIWTGTEMIVWGGRFGDYLNTGGRYDPAADSWTATSTDAGVPEARIGHTAVWTGTEMIIWGGNNSVPPYFHNSGGAYDPATDSWRATSTEAGVPAGRVVHTAVWTGREMIVWGGGLLHSSYQNTGGVYDPATDSWRETSAALDGRELHTAVWTGTEMIIWGGEGWTGYLDTGGRYDPASDTWRPTGSGTGIPWMRSEHTAVWTGAEMVVWGGYSGVFTDTGGRYDPIDDAWETTSTAPGVPAERYRQSAVWTGKQMIVWGGVGGPALNSGGMYCVCEGETVSVWYPDADGDGYGVESTSVSSCSAPPGYVAIAGDCDDSNSLCAADCTDVDEDGSCVDHDCDDADPGCWSDCADIDTDGYCAQFDCDDTVPATHPGAAEVNDGLDNQCPGELGHGLVDEITGECGFHNPVDADEFSCPLQAGATRYELARSPHPEFPNWVGCLRIVSDAATWVDSDPVPEGTLFYYLVRSHKPNTGSWGADSGRIERTVICHR